MCGAAPLPLYHLLQMPPLLGAATIVALLILILSNRCSPLVALIVVPVAAAIVAGYGTRTGAFMIEGVRNIAPVAAMFVFAIVFFGVMTDAGLLEPIVARVLRLVGERPTRIVPGTAALALRAHRKAPDDPGVCLELARADVALQKYTEARDVLAVIPGNPTSDFDDVRHDASPRTRA